LYFKTSFFLLLCVGLLAGCLDNSRVPGAYPPSAPKAARGAGIGAVTGAAVAGLAMNNGSIPLGMAVGAMLGAPIGSYSDTRGAIKSLALQGITVIHLGDIVEAIIPSDLVFDPETNQLNHTIYPMLDELVALLRQYGDVNMAVTGHSDNVGTDAARWQRSNLQAQAVMSYLWSHGVSLDQLNYYPVADSEPDASFKYANGQAYNRRVDIVFWRKGKPGPLSGLLVPASDYDCWTKSDPDDCDVRALM
jgi:outer membrane protein OmpA-like peptidoglycan-associated protein